MLKTYEGPMELVNLGYPPRLIISMDLYGDGMEVGANCHYSLDSDLKECCVHFFEYIRKNHSNYKIIIGRSKLDFEYVDLPKETKVEWQNTNEKPPYY